PMPPPWPPYSWRCSPSRSGSSCSPVPPAAGRWPVPPAPVTPPNGLPAESRLPPMTHRGIPDDVVEFLAQSIDSVEQLEVLLLLHQNPATEWTAESVARHLYREPTSVGRRLGVLRLLGLLL